ncbi:MAG: type II/IV secretion system ATPase subunit [Methanoregula sp.]|nr:type II/IV secretion system ATPase subunit [Methanoregula sp.]
MTAAKGRAPVVPEKSPTAPSVGDYLKKLFRFPGGRQPVIPGTESPETPVPECASADELVDRILPASALHAELPPLPPLDTVDESRVLDRYWLVPPFSYVNITRDWEMNPRYDIMEPRVSEKELILLEETYERLRTVLIYDSPVKRDQARLEDGEVRQIIREFDPEITEERLGVLVYYLRRNFNGYGKLDPFMHDEQIEDITCNGAGIPIFIYHRRFANLESNITFGNEELNKYVLKIAQKADKQMSLTSPLVDAALPGGARAQITYTDVISSKGSSFTIRKFKADPMTPVDLIMIGTYDSELMAYIWLLVENNKSMIVVGGTASGKTSTMNAISFFIPQTSKIVSIEDTREIQLPHKNWLPMRTREGGKNLDAGDVDMFLLLKTALRQRPEYIIVGEVRGAEAQTLFQAMNTGHTTFSTLHAGGVKEAINRLTHDPINVPSVMFGALDLMLIQGLQHKEGVGFRRCLSLNEMVVEGSEIRWIPLFEWNSMTDHFDRVLTKSAVLADIAYSHGWSEEDLASQVLVRKKLLERMVEKKITRIDEISHFINELRKKSEKCRSSPQ